MVLSESLRKQISDLVATNRVVVFMKGTRQMPQCGFSAQVVQILDELQPSYETVDVLRSPELRDGIKEFSQWPTIPQLYVGGQFIGGCDIVRNMNASGDLQKLLGTEVSEPAPPTITVSEAATKRSRRPLPIPAEIASPTGRRQFPVRPVSRTARTGRHRGPYQRANFPAGPFECAPCQWREHRLQRRNQQRVQDQQPERASEGEPTERARTQGNTRSPRGHPLRRQAGERARARQHSWGALPRCGRPGVSVWARPRHSYRSALPPWNPQPGGCPATA